MKDTFEWAEELALTTKFRFLDLANTIQKLRDNNVADDKIAEFIASTNASGYISSHELQLIVNILYDRPVVLRKSLFMGHPVEQVGTDKFNKAMERQEAWNELYSVLDAITGLPNMKPYQSMTAEQLRDVKKEILKARRYKNNISHDMSIATIILMTGDKITQ